MGPEVVWKKMDVGCEGECGSVVAEEDLDLLRRRLRPRPPLALVARRRSRLRHGAPTRRCPSRAEGAALLAAAIGLAAAAQLHGMQKRALGYLDLGACAARRGGAARARAGVAAL